MRANSTLGGIFVITLLLCRQIIQMFLWIFLGWLLVRLRLLKSSDSQVLSVVCLYLIYPCIIVNAFQMERTDDLVHSLMLSLSAAVGVHLFMFLLERLLRRPLHLNAVESASVLYPNTGNFVIPLVTAVLGKEWVIYSNMFIIVQLFFMWSHGRILLSGEKQISLKKIFLNVNVISAFVGTALFILNLPLPTLLSDTMDAIGGMVGPISMFVAGMLIASVDVKQLLRTLSIWKVAVLRLVVIPLSVMLVLKYSGAAGLVPEGETILLITLLATSTPSASSVTQIAQVYGKNSEYASAINGMTTLLCILTMPLVVLLYQL